MKQLLQNLKTGNIEMLETPAPRCSSSGVVIQTQVSLISAGTERMLNSFAKSNYIQKARQQPEKVKQVLNKAATDGIVATYNAVKRKLDQPIALGYSNVGRILEVGRNVKNLTVGDRVLSNGSHSEIVAIQKNLVVPIPDNVSDEAASFTVVGAIALQGIRLIEPEIGETVCVAGLGLIGLLAVQILRANGCRVFGFDHNIERVKLAQSYGAEAIQIFDNTDIVNAANAYTNNIGMDAVLITASTCSNELISQCAKMSRKRGRIVLTGVTGLNLDRADFYEKELSFQVSCSYGPGRYEHNFEGLGLDYPIGFVRWTETRNFTTILDLMSSGQIIVDKLLTNEFEFEKAEKAYSALSDPNSLGILLRYAKSNISKLARTIVYSNQQTNGKLGSKARLAIIGSGNFTQATLLPALKSVDADIRLISSSKGTSAAIAARQFSIPEVTTDTQSIFSRDDIDAVMITTPHNTHSRLIVEALSKNKSVFVEKPLCLTTEELNEITQTMLSLQTYDSGTPILMVGFNRRFAPMMIKMKSVLESRTEPAFIKINCNAGFLPSDHWTQDMERGGGRILGEACHFIDVARYLVGKPIIQVKAMKLEGGSDLNEDTVSITLGFDDGSLAQVNYYSNASSRLPKEHYSASWNNKTIVLDNFLKLTGYGVKLKERSMKQVKGHAGECKAFISNLIEGRDSPIPFAEIENVMLATFAALRSLRNIDQNML